MILVEISETGLGPPGPKVYEVFPSSVPNKQKKKEKVYAVDAAVLKLAI